MEDASASTPKRDRLGAMSDHGLFAPGSPIMRPDSFHRGENCADVALAMIAADGCRAISAGTLANALGVTPPAVLKWFGSTALMWEQLTDVIARRWCAYLGRESRLQRRDLDVFQTVSLFLPLDPDEIEWTRVWLSMLELGRHQDLVGGRLALWEAQEMEVLYGATMCRDVPTLTATLVLVRGLRQMVASTHAPLDLALAHQFLRRHVQHTYVANGIPEPASADDALPSTRQFTLFRPRRSSE